MYVVIAGGGRTASQLAALLVEQQHQVVVLEPRSKVLRNLHRELPTEVIIEGDPTNPEVLRQAKVDRADVLAACTSDDATNLALCHYARTHFDVPRTIARVNHPNTAWLFNELFHVDVALNQAEILASLIEEEMSLGDMMTLLKLRRGAYSLVEEKLPGGAPVVGVPLGELELPDDCVIAGIIRRGKLIIPRGETVFEAEDEVLAVVGPDGAEHLALMLGGATQGTASGN